MTLTLTQAYIDNLFQQHLCKTITFCRQHYFFFLTISSHNSQRSLCRIDQIFLTHMQGQSHTINNISWTWYFPQRSDTLFIWKYKKELHQHTMKIIPPIPDLCCTVSSLPNTYTKVNFYTVLTMLLNKFSQPQFSQRGVKNSTLRHKMSQYRNVQYVWQQTVQM